MGMLNITGLDQPVSPTEFQTMAKKLNLGEMWICKNLFGVTKHIPSKYMALLQSHPNLWGWGDSRRRVCSFPLRLRGFA